MDLDTHVGNRNRICKSGITNVLKHVLNQDRSFGDTSFWGAPQREHRHLRCTGATIRGSGITYPLESQRYQSSSDG